jgi:hypothetical protein
VSGNISIVKWIHNVHVVVHLTINIYMYVGIHLMVELYMYVGESVQVQMSELRIENVYVCKGLKLFMQQLKYLHVAARPALPAHMISYFSA